MTLADAALRTELDANPAPAERHWGAKARESTKTSVRMPARMQTDLFRIAERRAPAEMVCLVAAPSDDPYHLVAISEVRNDAPEPLTHFTVRPFDQWRLETRWLSEHRRMRAVAHSHPRRDANPSQADLALCPEDMLMIIVSLQGSVTAWECGVQLTIELEEV